MQLRSLITTPLRLKLNQEASMLVKTCVIGKRWDGSLRNRETLLMKVSNTCDSNSTWQRLWVVAERSKKLKWGTSSDRAVNDFRICAAVRSNFSVSFKSRVRGTHSRLDRSRLLVKPWVSSSLVSLQASQRGKICLTTQKIRTIHRKLSPSTCTIPFPKTSKSSLFSLKETKHMPRNSKPPGA